jgi:hypothetical protein
MASLGTLALAFALMALSLSCRGPYDAAWRTLDGVQRARDLTAQQLAAAAMEKHLECKKLHGVKNEKFAACIKKHRESLEYWQRVARPAANSAIQVTATALQIAERAKKDDLKWLPLLRPAVCALMRIARAWGHYYPDSGKAVLGALQTVEGVTCD